MDKISERSQVCIKTVLQISVDLYVELFAVLFYILNLLESNVLFS